MAPSRRWRADRRAAWSIFVDDEEFPAGSGLKTLASATVSTVVRSTNNVPILVERAMWWPGPTVTNSHWYEAHNSPGATGTATRWVLGGAEVCGVDGADTFVLIANTTATAGRAEVSIVGDDYIVGTLTVDLPARSRTTVSLAGSFPTNPLAGRVGVTVESVGATPVPIVVERAMWWPGSTLTSDFWYEAHNSPGVTGRATRWLVAGGEMAGPAHAETYVLIANPGDTAGRVRLTLLGEGGRTWGPDVTVAAKSRTTVRLAPPVTFGATDAFSVLVESLGASPVPIVVEHATYASPGGATGRAAVMPWRRRCRERGPLGAVFWGRGGNALAEPLR